MIKEKEIKIKELENKLIDIQNKLNENKEINKVLTKEFNNKNNFIKEKEIKIKELENKFYSYHNQLKVNLNFELLFKNTHIIKSDICGLGKSTLIKNKINNKNKKYIYFPLGGNIKKDYIYKKLLNILQNIETKNDYNDVAIHLDLFENKEHFVLNEFLFSFLIKKKYSNDENIIFIPKNIEIYIEIPNCFNDFMNNYGVLKFFVLEVIKLDEIPKLNLSNEKIIPFKKIDCNSNEEIYKFISSNIGIRKYSYHQINIFINLFISLFNFKGNKLIFFKEEKDVTQIVINNFSRMTKYFTFSEFSKLLIGHVDEKKNKMKEDEYINLLSRIYEYELKEENFENPLIFINKKKQQFFQIDISEKGLKKYQKTIDYLKELKSILNLENTVENSENKNKISLIEIIKNE